MRRITRREFLTTLAASAFGLLVPGCSDKRSEPGRTVLTYNTFWTGLDAHASVMDWLYAEFRKRHPEIDLRVVQVAGGAQDNGQKLMAELAAGGGPDVLHDTTYDQVRPGYCLDLTDHIRPWRDRFYPEALASCTWGGRVYSLPTEYSMVPCIWNTKLLRKVGKDIPSTFDEYLEVGRALRKIGVPLTSLSMNGAHIFFSILFGDPRAPEVIRREQWESEPFLRAVKVVKKIRDEGLIPENDIELQFANGASLFQQDRMGHYMNGAWTLINEIAAEGVDPTLRERVAFAPFPAYEGARPIRAWVATKTAINSKLADEPAKLKAALTFLEFFTSRESARRFISMAHSPQGVKVELTKEEAGPLLYEFMNTRRQATSVFVIPNDPGYFSEQSQARALPDMFAAIDEGASAKEALRFFAEVLMS